MNKKTRKASVDTKNTKKKKKSHKKLKIFIEIFIVLAFILAIILASFFVARFKVAMDEFDAGDLIIGDSNSVIVDSNNNVLATLNGDEKRKIIGFEEMPKNLVNAYVAIEDERFYQHSGVDFKRTGAAILNFVTRAGSTSFGGSTITQQLVKNATSDNEKTIDRKIKEWARAYKVEEVYSKQQIMETYLNIIFVGQDYYGVEMGAQYYFSKSAKDMSLAECAFLAGINNSPNAYKPFAEDPDGKYKDKINKRTKTVLTKMRELEYIETDEAYNNAIAEVDNGLAFNKGGITGNIYSYHTDALIAKLIEDISNEKGLSKELATNYLYGGGLTIHSTQDTAIQNVVDEEMKNSRYVLESNITDGVFAEAAIAIIDHNNGHVVALGGGLGEKKSSRGLNRATQSKRQTGSAFKPLAVVAPAIQERIITASKMYDDAQTTFQPGNYTPKNYNGFRGWITVRQAVETSQNIPFCKIMQELTVEKSKDYLKRMGITSLTARDVGLSVAIGGLDQGVTPLEMAGAYASIANNGEYIEPILYTKVVDSKGNVVLQKNQRKEKIFDDDADYVTKTIIQEPVMGGQGTAKYCGIPYQDTAAKTGTTNKDYDRWLCGFTNYYTAAVWYGFDKNETVVYPGTNPAGLIWSNIMKKIHEGKDPKTFNRPSGVIDARICRETHKCASESCSDTFVDKFLTGTVPEVCEGHAPVEEVPADTNVVNPEDMGITITEIEGNTNKTNTNTNTNTNKTNTNTNTNKTTTNTNTSSSSNTTSTTNTQTPSSGATNTTSEPAGSGSTTPPTPQTPPEEKNNDNPTTEPPVIVETTTEPATITVEHGKIN